MHAYAGNVTCARCYLLLLLLKLFLPLDQIRHTLDHLIDESHFVLAHPIHIGYVTDTIILRCAREAARSTSLKLPVRKPFLESWLFRSKRNLQHHGSTETCTAVRRARQDVTVHRIDF